MAAAIRGVGAKPAICLAVDGELHVGAGLDRLEQIACSSHREKASVRDLGYVLARRLPAGLTVSATVFCAALTGIRTFATGGIGGVHLGANQTGDISADLPQLARSPVVTVCAGAKSVLDIPRTLEYLETAGVPVYGFATDQFPAFYLRSSGCAIPRLDRADEVAGVARRHWGLGLSSGIVVGNPLPDDLAISPTLWSAWIDEAEKKAIHNGVRGKDVTPYLLAEVARLSEGETVRANIELLMRNARLAAEIALSLAA
jgi:pseudouridine-5'-phosphate glycosidase